MDIRKNSKLIILFSILISVIFTIHAMIVIIKYPLIGIKLYQENEEWLVDEIYKEGWASNHSIRKGDTITLIDGKKVEGHLTVNLLKRVEKAKTITISTREQKDEQYSISYRNANKNQGLLVLFPLIFNGVMVLFSLLLYLTVKVKRDAILLIYFLLSLGICYLSAFISARGDIIGWYLTSMTLSTSVILLLHFLKEYFTRYNVSFIASSSLKILHIVNVLIIVFVFIDQLILKTFGTVKLQLLFFGILNMILVYHLFQFYFKQKNSKGRAVIKILGLTVFLAFGPFIFFYALPNVLGKEVLISSEVAAVFLIIIPIGLVYLLLAEKLFDIEFMFNRLRYYSLLAVPFSLLTVLLVCFILRVRIDMTKIVLVVIVLYVMTVFLLYVKEYVDYKLRSHLFSTKGNFEMSLHTFYQKTKHEMKVDSLVKCIQIEIKNVLSIKDIFYSEVYTENQGANWWLENERSYSYNHIQKVEKIDWAQYAVGSLIEVNDGYGIVIGGNHHRKKAILFGMKDSKTNLNIQEKVWLETLAYFSSILLENFQRIEELVIEIEHYKEDDHHPPWLSRLLFSLAEKERKNFSIDLHDTVLQEQLQILRELDFIINKVQVSEIENELLNLKERMLDTIHLVRETCNELQPPFLSEIGVIQSIQNLINETKLRCSFTLRSELDYSIYRLGKEVELTLYRVVQELLNNAMEHSEASNVDLKITKQGQVIELYYQDDGIGFDMDVSQDSFKTMGLFGIRERIRSIGGHTKMISAKGKGMSVCIEVSVEVVND